MRGVGSGGRQQRRPDGHVDAGLGRSGPTPRCSQARSSRRSGRTARTRTRRTVRAMPPSTWVRMPKVSRSRISGWAIRPASGPSPGPARHHRPPPTTGVPSMSSHMPAKVLAVLGLLTIATAAQAAVECPPVLTGTPAYKPSACSRGTRPRQVELAPGSVAGPNGSYVNTWPLRLSIGLVGVCRFEGAPDQMLQLPPGLVLLSRRRWPAAAASRLPLACGSKASIVAVCNQSRSTWPRSRPGVACHESTASGSSRRESRRHARRSQISSPSASIRNTPPVPGRSATSSISVPKVESSSCAIQPLAAATCTECRIRW